ncbi:MAG TPA: PD-(D/E)XK nuclease family protein [Geobacteraceae bacterium]
MGYNRPMSATLHILPSTAAVDAFIRRAVEESGVLFGIPALTLRRLAEEIAGVCDEGRRPISTVGRRLLLEEIVRDRYRDGTGYFVALRDLPGFVGAIDSLFGELKQALVAPAAFAATVRRLAGAGRLAELASLYEAYTVALAGKELMDRHDLELSALAHLRAGGSLPPLFDGVSEISCRDIYDLTPLQLALLAEVSRRLPVELRLPWNPEREALYGYVSRTADAVEALDNSELRLEPLFAEPAGTFLTPVLAALFEGEETIAPPGEMALMAAPGPYRECEEIGRRIRGLLEAGTDPAAIGVLFRDLRGYGPMMEDVCRRYRIPVSYRRGVPLFTSPLVRACLAPFAAVRSRLGREDLLSLVKSSYIDLPLFGVSPDVIEEVLVAAGYLDETFGGADEAIGRRIAFLEKLELSGDREERVRRALSPLLRELRRFKGNKTLREFAELLEGFIERHRMFRRGIAAADPRALKRDASAITLLRQVLQDLERDMQTLGLAEEPLSPADFVALVKQGMEGAYLAGERGAGVAILNFHDARGLRFDHLFIGGLNEGLCPMRHDGHPLFKDTDKLLFHRASGGRPFRTAREKGEEEPLLFYLAIGCAGTSLSFSYSYLDGRGNGMLRSPFLEELLAKVPLAESRIPVNRITPEPAQCLEREELLNALAARRALCPGGEDTLPIGESLARIGANARMEAERERFFQAEEKGARAALASPFTGALRRDDIVAELCAWYASAEGSRFAPTTLEEYGGCPFRYFLRRLLKVVPLEKPEMELAAKDEGSLVHEILCAFFRRLRDEGRLPLRDPASAREIMREEAEAVFARWEGERHTGEPLLWEIEKGRLLAILERVAELEAEDASGLVPELFEHPFDDLAVADDDGSRVVLTGKIDRVDVATADGRLRVVDYKMGGDSGKYGALLKKENLGETSFQMPVYLLAAAREMGKASGAPPTRFTARYWLLRKLDRVDRDFSGGKEDFTGFFAADHETRRLMGEDNFLNRLCGKVRGMKRGDFQITPKECGFCQFGGVCRYVAVAVREEG